MPTVSCVVCKRLQNITASERKLVDSDQHVCSLSCLLRWIRTKRPVLRIPATRLTPNVMLTGEVWSAEDARFYRSGYEVRVAAFLKSQGISYDYESLGFRVGSAATYTPDFFLPRHACFLEVKGIWMIGAKTKFRKFRKQYKDIPIMVVPWLLVKGFKGELCVVR